MSKTPTAATSTSASTSSPRRRRRAPRAGATSSSAASITFAYVLRSGSVGTNEPTCETCGVVEYAPNRLHVQCVRHPGHDWHEWGGAMQLTICQRCGVIRCLPSAIPTSPARLSRAPSLLPGTRGRKGGDAA